MKIHRIGFLGAAILLSAVAAQAGDAGKGEALFTSRACVSCHAIGSEGSATTGPNLAGVASRRSKDWLIRWIGAPDKMKDDPVYKELKKTYAADMPNLGLSADETMSLVLYLIQKSQDQKQ